MTTGLNSVLADGNYTDYTYKNSIRIRETRGRVTQEGPKGGTAERTFLTVGSADPTVCRDALLDSATPNLKTYDGLGLESMSSDRVAQDAWEWTCHYNSLTPGDPGTYTVSIDTTGATITQVSAFAQTAYAAAGRTAVDYGKAVDVREGKPQGVERIIPALKITIRAKIATAYISSVEAYSRLISTMTGTMNNATMFSSFAAGELLFMGANGVVVGEDPVLDFVFLASENKSSWTIGDVVGITKKGHDFIWFDYYTAKDATANKRHAKVNAAYVSQVYSSAAHGDLKIGVA